MSEHTDERPIYSGPVQIRVEFLEQRINKLEERMLSTAETLIRLDERTEHLANEISAIRSDVSVIRVDVRREVTTIKRFFYGLGAAFAVVAVGVIADLIALIAQGG